MGGAGQHDDGGARRGKREVDVARTVRVRRGVGGVRRPKRARRGGSLQAWIDHEFAGPMSSPRNRRASMARPARAARLRNPGRGSSRPRSHVGASAPRGTRPRSAEPQDVDAPHGAHAARPRRRRRPDGIEARAIGRARPVPRERVNAERRRCVHAARDERFARRGTTVRPSVVRGEDGRCGRRDRRRGPLSSASAVRVRWERERGALSLASRRSAVSNLIGQRSRSQGGRSRGSCGGRSLCMGRWALVACGAVGAHCAWCGGRSSRNSSGRCSSRVARWVLGARRRDSMSWSSSGAVRVCWERDRSALSRWRRGAALFRT